jgi:plastocyanin
MSNSRIAVVIIVLVAIVGGAVAATHKSKSPAVTSYSSSNSSNSSSTNSSSSQTSAVGNIDIKNMMFTPSQITVQKGGTVTWTNNDSTAHRVVDDLSNVGGPASGDIQPGSSYSFKFEKTGSFQYHCSIHPSMRGTIVVK